jgi:multidrug resistance efflux pump
MKFAQVPLIRSLAARAAQLLDRLLCVAGAVLFSQAPEFMQQYLQRLEGHLDESRRQLAALTRAAESSGLTLDQLVADATRNVDPAIARLGGVAQGAVQRVAALQASDDALRHASALTRPFVFLAHLDPGILRGTAAIFRPAVPTTLEGLGYAALGVVAALALYHVLIRAPLRGLVRRRALRRGRETGATG